MMRRALLLLPMLALSACLGLGGKTPATLITLAADARVEPGTTRTAAPGAAVTVLPPSVPQALASVRLPVTTGAGIAYLKGAQWSDAPARLFRDLLSETIAARTGRPVLDLRQYALSPGMRLSGRLMDFGYDAGSRTAIVTYDAALARPGDQPVQTRRFQASAPVAAEDPATVAAALNRAANQVAGEVSGWIGS